MTFAAVAAAAAAATAAAASPLRVAAAHAACARSSTGLSCCLTPCSRRTRPCLVSSAHSSTVTTVVRHDPSMMANKRNSIPGPHCGRSSSRTGPRRRGRSSRASHRSEQAAASAGTPTPLHTCMSSSLHYFPAPVVPLWHFQEDSPSGSLSYAVLSPNTLACNCAGVTESGEHTLHTHSATESAMPACSGFCSFLSCSSSAALQYSSDSDGCPSRPALQHEAQPCTSCTVMGRMSSNQCWHTMEANSDLPLSW